MSKVGICPRCNKGPRHINYREPETRAGVCQTCYFNTTGKVRPAKIGICSNCGKGPRQISYIDKATGKNICAACHLRAKCEEARLSVSTKSLPASVAEPVVVKPPRRGSKHPGNDVLERLIRDCQANLSLMVGFLLKNQGIKARANELSKWIRGDDGLRKLAADVRKARVGKKAEVSQRKPYPVLSQPKTEVAQLEKPAREQAECVSREIKGEALNLPLSEEELEVLETPGKSAGEISRKIHQGGGRVESIIRSILLKENATTLEEVRKKLGIALDSQEEVVKEQKR